MNSTHAESEDIARLIFSAIPEIFGLRFHHASGVTHFVSDRCVLRFGWERYEAKLTSTQFLDPSQADANGGMSFWILQLVLGFKLSVRDDADPHYELGMSIANHCDALLRGDFAIRPRYDSLEKRILDRIDEVNALPNNSEIRLLYDACDIKWLAAIESGDYVSG